MSFSNVEALIAEIESDFSKYSDANLINRESIYRDIALGLKRFGNDICQVHETVVEVKEGYAELPRNFFSLYAAYMCEPMAIQTDIEVHDLQESLFYKEKTINSTTWNECDPTCKTVTESVIQENLYFNNNRVTFHYNNPQLLRLGKSFLRNNCHAKCRNKIVRDNPNEIVIIDYRLQANFNSGTIYLQYFGLPVDEEGNIEIPETANGHLETYLEYYIKRRLAERLMGNNEAQGLSNLYSVFAQQEQIALKNASNELKMKSIKPGFARRFQRINRLESLQFESSLTKWH